MNRIALCLALLSITPPVFAGNLYCAPVVKHGYVAPVKYAAPVYAQKHVVEKVVQYPSVQVNTYVVAPDALIKGGQSHYTYAKIGEYSGFDANLAVERLNRTFETVAASVPQVGQLVAQTISQADAQKHALYLHQSESASVVAELRELKEVVRELRSGRQTTAIAPAPLPDGALAVQAVGLATCVKCHAKYADPSKLSFEEVNAAVKKIYAGEMPLAADKTTPIPLSDEDAAAVIAELYGAK